MAMDRSSLVVVVMIGGLGCGSTVTLESSGGAGGSANNSSASSTSAATATATSGPGGAGAGGGAGDTGGSGSTGVSRGPWRADMWIGQVDHLSIRHLSESSDTCIFMHATAPGGTSAYDLTVPEPWAVNQITAWDTTEGCMDDPFTPAEPSQSVSTAQGQIDFVVPAMQFYPCDLDVDMEITFVDAPAWLPASLVLQTTMLVVNGACP